MQMTYEQALRPGGLMWFASRRGSGYMMRSEKRDGGYGSPNRRPPRRKKAGFIYIFFTLLLSVILWPVGMVMLWQRKVRMTAGTKLVISLLTLCLSVFLIVFTLTVPLDNVKFTAFQDKANDWLDKAAADVAVAGDAAMKKTQETWQAMSDFSKAEAAYAGAYTADAIDAGVEAAGKARAAIESLFRRKEDAPSPTEAPEATALPAGTEVPEGTETPATTDAPEKTEAPAATDAPEKTEAPATTDAPEKTEAPAITDAPEDAGTAEATAEPMVLVPIASEAPEATKKPRATKKPKATEAPATEAPVVMDIRLPEASPAAEDAKPLGEGTLHANGEFEPGAVDAPTNAPAADAAPLTEATAIPLKPATALPTEAVSEAPTEAATEAPTEAPAEAATEAPVETVTEAPVENATEAPVETVTEAPVETVTEAPVETVTEAPTEAPVEAPTEAPAGETDESTIVWTPLEEATAAPTEAPAEQREAAPVEAADTYTVKPAGQATVYFFDNGSVGFHNGPKRHDMPGAPAHTLQEAFDMGKNPCSSCGMPDKSILDEPHVAWVDADNRIHTTDACEAFKGQWRLMPLEKAISAGYEPCEECGAGFYVEEIFPAPTPTPEPETVTPAVALKPVSEIPVYYYNSSKGYHIGPNCTGMQNAPAHTLAEAAASGKKTCKHCNPPSTSLLGQAVLWQDADGVCHTTDTCASFTGSYRLVLRNDALAQGFAACPDCGAADYLIPGTVLAGQ